MSTNAHDISGIDSLDMKALGRLAFGSEQDAAPGMAGVYPANGLKRCNTKGELISRNAGAGGEGDGGNGWQRGLQAAKGGRGGGVVPRG